MFSGAPVLGVGLICLWSVLLAFFLERKVLNRLFFPPFTAVIVWSAMGTGIGIPVMASTSYFQEFVAPYRADNWTASLFAAQCCYLLAFPFAWLGYWVGGFRAVASIRGDSNHEVPSPSLLPQIVPVAWASLLIAVFLITAKSLLGMEDRGALGGTDGHSLPYSFLLNVIPKFSMMGFVFLPLLWRSGGRREKIVCLLLVGTYAGFALASGTRGFVLFMVFFLFLGAYLFRTENSRLFETGLISLAVVGVLLTSVLLAYRTSPNFHRTTSKELGARLKLLITPGTYDQSFAFGSEGVYRFGYSLYGLDDHIIFALTPTRIPHAGFAGFSALIWTWVPSTFLPGKPPLLDAETVIGAYENPPVEKRPGTMISLSADAWRRFGWAGIPPVVFLFWALYGLLCRWCMARWMGGTIFGWCLLVFMLMFFWNRPFGTVLGTWWTFFYDTPKQLLATAVLCFLVSKAVEWTQRGDSDSDTVGRSA